MDKPAWLPEPLNPDDYEDWERLEDAAYRIFCQDFIDKEPPLHHEKLVKLNFDKDLREIKGREKSFYHLVKKTEDKRSRRIVEDPLRAARIGWVRPLIENSDAKDVRIWDYWESDYSDFVRRYIWLENYRFVVILQEEVSEFVLITAYYVDREDRLKNKYNKRIK